VSFAAITFRVASQRVFVVVNFVINTVPKLLDTSSYHRQCTYCHPPPTNLGEGVDLCHGLICHADEARGRGPVWWNESHKGQNSGIRTHIKKKTYMEKKERNC
jgi:hypothetical protein